MKIKSTLRRYKCGIKFWTIKGTWIYHRENGPAIEHSSGEQFWYYNGMLHRNDEPAFMIKAYQAWYHYGVRHREDGPAYIKGNCKQYYLNGQLVSKKQHQHLVKLKAFW